MHAMLLRRFVEVSLDGYLALHCNANFLTASDPLKYEHALAVANKYGLHVGTNAGLASINLSIQLTNSSVKRMGTVRPRLPLIDVQKCFLKLTQSQSCNCVVRFSFLLVVLQFDFGCFPLPFPIEKDELCQNDLRQTEGSICTV